MDRRELLLSVLALPLVVKSTRCANGVDPVAKSIRSIRLYSWSITTEYREVFDKKLRQISLEVVSRRSSGPLTREESRL